MSPIEEIERLKLEIDTLGDLLTRARAELAAELLAERAHGFRKGYNKGLEDAAQLVDEWQSPRFPSIVGHAIRALKPLLAPWEGAALLGVGDAQSPASTTAPADEPPQTARLPGLRDQPIEW